MPEDEVLKIITDSKNQGERVSLLADEFRRGRDLGELIILLNSNNEDIIAIGAWIGAEIHFDKASACFLISRLHQLLKHKNPAIRFHSFGALFPHLDPTSRASQEMVKKLSRDPNEGVRTIALAALAKIQKSSEQLAKNSCAVAESSAEYYLRALAAAAYIFRAPWVRSAILSGRESHLIQWLGQIFASQLSN